MVNNGRPFSQEPICFPCQGYFTLVEASGERRKQISKMGLDPGMSVCTIGKMGELLSVWADIRVTGWWG